MMNLLVVDDEYYIVRGIVEDIDRKRLGIGEIHTAYSMKQAQDVMDSHDIDILLSDIEMPRGSGLDLLAWCRERGHDPVALFLTGHQNFDYARQAMGLRSLDYLLKPIRPEILKDHLAKAAEEVAKKRNRNREADQAEHWRSNRPVRTKTFWTRLLGGEIPPDRDGIARYLSEQQLPPAWAEKRYVLSLFQLEDLPPGGEEAPAAGDVLGEPIVRLGLADSRECLVKLSKRSFALATPSRGYGSYCGEMERALPIISGGLGCPVSVYLSGETPLEGLSSRLGELKKTATRIKALGSRVIRADRFENGTVPEAGEEPRAEIPMDRWSEWLLQYRTDLIGDDLKRIMEEDFKFYSTQKLISLYHGIIRLIYSCLAQKDMDAGRISPRMTNYEDLSKAISSMNRFLSWADTMLRESAAVLKGGDDSRSIVEKVRNIVRAHLNWDGLNRTFIADEIHLNPDYLSHLFRKQSGLSLTAFINGERIEAAKRLLLTTDMTMSFIAETVGYLNTPYFYRQFKKNAGMTPRQYRESKSE